MSSHTKSSTGSASKILENAVQDALSKVHDAHFRRILEKLPAGAYICNPDGLITYFNAQAINVWGRAPALNDPVDRFCGSFKLFTTTGTPITHDQCWMALALQTGEEYIGEEIMIERPDGSRITALAHASPIRDDSGTLIGAVNILIDVTERKKIEESLRRKEAELMDFVESSTIGMHWVGADGTILWANQAELELLGYTEGEYVGRNIADFHADAPVIEDILCRLQKGEKLKDYSAKLRHKDGSIREVVIDSSVLWDGDRFVHTRCFTRDVTSQKQADMARGLLAAIVESSDDIIISQTLEGVIRSWNSGAERILGYTAEEVVGRSITVIIPPERQAEEHEIMGRLKQGQRIDSFETVRRAKDGRLIDISLTASLVRDSTGAIIGASKVGRDITERKKAERALAAMNEHLNEMVQERTQELELARQLDRTNLVRFQMMIENLLFAAVAMDENFTILQVNDNFCTMFDVPYSAKQMVGRNGYDFSKYIRDKVLDLDAYMAQLTAMLEKKEPVVGYDIPLKDGRIILRDYFPIFDHGVYRGQLLLFRDVTRERRIDRTKSEFMSLASHQLRTPITAIRWGMKRMEKQLKDKVSDQDLAFFRQSYDAAIRMSATIDTMLQISRIEAGQVNVQQVEVDVSAFVRQMTDSFREAAQAKRLSLECDCATGVTIKTDPALLEQLLDNLMSNAVKYTPEEGTVHVEVRTNADLVEIIINDTGYGIPKRQQQDLFRKFFRGDNVVSRDTEGTGLGLYMSALIASLLRGKIACVSKEGKGSTFTLSLPLGL